MNKYRKTSVVLLVLYTALILWLTVFSRKPGDTVIFNVPMFRSYSYRYIYYGDYRLVPNVIFNLLLFIPFGLFFALSFGNNRFITWVIIVLSAALMSSAIEFTQHYFQIGQFEIDDIINNTIGSAIGCGLFPLFKRYIDRND